MKKQQTQSGLRDIGARLIDVQVGDVTLKVRGLSARDILTLMNRFEPVRKMLEGGRAEVAKNIATPNAPQTLIATLPDAVWSAMATCTGTTPELREEDEKIASELAFGDQVAIVNAIFQATFREGVGPFMVVLDQLTRMMQPATRIALAPATPTVSRNDSPPQSPAALHVDLDQKKRGRLHLAS